MVGFMMLLSNSNILWFCCHFVDIEFQQRRKRRKLFRERSISPVIVDDDLLPQSSIPLEKLVADGTHRYDSAVSSGPDLQLKALFMFKFDLLPTDFQLKQSENH
jgi:hypothetical protein